MSYWIQDNNNHSNPNRKSFCCDNISDIQKLPTQFKNGEAQDDDSVASYPVAFGSDCLCLEDSSVWVLGKETDSWIQI